MSKFHDLGDQGGERFVGWNCPGCEYCHEVPVTGPRAWQWNGSLDKPTLHPSIVVNRGKSNPQVPVCHSWVKDGVIQFLPDSTHRLAGQSIAVPDWEAS
jgi:hypothetical protein